VERLQRDGEGALTVPTNAEWVDVASLSGFTDFLARSGDYSGAVVGGMKHFTPPSR
jgi:hypothetical protein